MNTSSLSSSTKSLQMLPIIFANILMFAGGSGLARCFAVNFSTSLVDMFNARKKSMV
ncbi:uncharacterized protein LY89DRAFT_689884 [Mollisia scopiformis]|uniref:Uncharacterized protein n=1 Tax=Mollisia scopiformis TaxID=149040 RepID=A0A132BEA7_MOLSC|nr:uncharacterized protein LY89DRAFT_689884 [Mollisia scopiformis]KUJ10007.1 hypothetical protein LY89DRAFT_689884 [Mollisia scopiformis]